MPEVKANDPKLHWANDGRPPRRVFLDGSEIADVLRCHTGEGWVEQVVRDEDGHFFMRHDGSDDIATQILHGKVTVEYKEATHAHS